MALKQLEQNNHEVSYHDLYAETFNPVLPFAELPDNASLEAELEAYCGEISAAEGIVIVHPNWWGQPPAMLKGWVDRIFRQGTIYQFGENGVDSKIAGKTALVFTTSNTPRDIELEVYGDPLQNLWETCIFGLCGITNFTRTNFESIIMSSQEEREQWLAELRETVKKQF